MFSDELDRIEKQERKLQDSRENRKLLPVDSHSQLDTGFTGRPDTDMKKQDEAAYRRVGLMRLDIV